MINIANLLRWEWFKLQRRWIPWILLALLLLFSQISVWGSFFSYSSLERTGGEIPLPVEAGREGPFGPRPEGRIPTVSVNDLLAGDFSHLPADMTPEVIAGLVAQAQQQVAQQQAQLQRLYDDFAMPGSIPNALRTAQTFGLILLAILTASLIGTEYGLGTLRSVLVRGTGRWPYLAVKFLTLAVTAAVALLLVLGVTALSSLIATALAGSPPGDWASPNWADAGVALGKAWFSFIPYLALTGFMTVLVRSSAAGMAIGLGYYFAEQIVVQLFSNFFDWFSTVADYLLMQNISAWAGGFSFGAGGGGGPGTLHSFLVLAVYTVAFGIAAFWLFQRRDIAGASGG